MYTCVFTSEFILYEIVYMYINMICNNIYNNFIQVLKPYVYNWYIFYVRMMLISLQETL